MRTGRQRGREREREREREKERVTFTISQSRTYNQIFSGFFYKERVSINES